MLRRSLVVSIAIIGSLGAIFTSAHLLQLYNAEASWRAGGLATLPSGQYMRLLDAPAPGKCHETCRKTYVILPFLGKDRFGKDRFGHSRLVTTAYDLPYKFEFSKGHKGSFGF